MESRANECSLESELPWLCGYENSAPVRIGNAAHQQFQLDVYGEVIDTLHVARKYKLERNDDAWRLQSALMDFLESGWKQPDEGIWEVRGPRRRFHALEGDGVGGGRSIGKRDT